MSASARAKLLLAKYGVILALVFLLVGLGAFGLAYSTYADPPTETLTDQIDREEYAFGSQEEAIVNTSTPGLYRPGEVLVDMPVYFVNESPELTVHVNTSVPEDATVDVDQRLTLRHQAAREEEIFWEQEEVLAADDSTVTDGETTISATIDMDRVQSFVNGRQERIGGVGNIQTFLVMHVEYESDRYDGSLESDTQVRFTGAAYWIEDELSERTTESETVSETITLDPDFGEISLFGGLGVLFVVLSIGAFGFAHRGVDTERIETELARAEYSEWISNGEIPTKSEKEYVKVESLEDVVDIAIDTNKRVIFDAHLDAYGVIDGDLVYYYSPDADEIEHWLEV